MKHDLFSNYFSPSCDSDTNYETVRMIKQSSVYKYYTHTYTQLSEWLNERPYPTEVQIYPSMKTVTYPVLFNDY